MDKPEKNPKSSTMMNIRERLRATNSLRENEEKEGGEKRGGK